MTTLKQGLHVERKQPGWKFWLLWVAATYVGGFLYFVPVSAVHFLLGLDRLPDPPRPGDISAGMLIVAAVLCGAAMGSSIGLAQWLVLRTQLVRTGWWILATIAGYASVGLLPLLASVVQPGWQEWAFTLIISGKLHWLARVEETWTNASWLPGAVTLTLFGAVLGTMQWLVLRGRVRQAGWWIAISACGWALAAALSVVPDDFWVVTLSWVIPLLVSGAGMVWLLRHPAGQM